MEEEEEFYITDLFSISGESESTTIVINGESVEFRNYRVFVLNFSNFRRLFPFSDLLEITDQQIQKESYEKCPIENWIKDYSPEWACLILRDWSKEGYKITETNDILKLLLVFLLSRGGDRIATKERDRITSKLIAEGQFVLIFEDKAILNFEQLSQLYREFITFSDVVKSTTYKKLDIDVLLFSLFNDIKESNIKRRHDALYLLSKLSKRYFTRFIFGYDRPYFLQFYELFFRKFLNRYNMSKLHKVLLLTFLGIHVEFVDNFLFEVILHPGELDYIFVESGYNRIEIGFVSKYVQILAYDGTIPKEKLEDLMTYLLKNSEEYFISNDNIRKKRFIFRKFKYSDAYLNQFETIPLNKTTLRPLIVNKVLERPENSLEIKELITLKLENERTARKKNSLKDMHKTIAFVLDLLQKYPLRNPFTSTVMDVQYEDTNSADNDPHIALFYQIVEKIKKAKEDEDHGYELNGIFIKVDPLDFLQQLFIDTQYFYLYILTGFFSLNDSELFQRLVTYFQALVECWEFYLVYAEDDIRYSASKGDGYLMGERELIDLVKWVISDIGCGFKIYPTLIRGKHFEEKEFYVNFLKIVEDRIYTNRIFIRFRNSRFSKEAKERLIDEVKTRTKPD